jgi:prepilin-type N-terminal cleavage/methylation domain-containing protein
MRPHPTESRAGFTLVELLIVISIIGIIAAMVISSYSNASQDSREVVVMQQQAVLQSALDDWIANSSSIGSAQATYNATSGDRARLDLIKGYLDDLTTAQFSTTNTSQGFLQSGVMQKTAQYVSFGAWTSGSYPKVQIQNVP